jgi:hypothetical protein
MSIEFGEEAGAGRHAKMAARNPDSTSTEARVPNDSRAQRWRGRAQENRILVSVRRIGTGKADGPAFRLRSGARAG